MARKSTTVPDGSYFSPLPGIFLAWLAGARGGDNFKMQPLRRLLSPAPKIPQMPFVVMSDPLSGHVILVVEPEIDQFVLNLQAALEKRGAETLAVRGPARAFERMREFRFSAGVLNYDHASDALHTLIDDLSGIPILLYGGEGASVACSRKVPHLTFTHPSVVSIVSTLGRLLRATRH